MLAQNVIQKLIIENLSRQNITVNAYLGTMKYSRKKKLFASNAILTLKWKYVMKKFVEMASPSALNNAMMVMNFHEMDATTV